MILRLPFEQGERGGLAPWHRCLEKGVEGDRLKINSGLSFFFLAGQTHSTWEAQAKAGYVHSHPMDADTLAGTSG